jgi:glyceraldehyde 3-phosphate dehydrogenase
VAVNDLGDPENLAYLLTYDTAFGRSAFDVILKDGNLEIDGSITELSAEREPEKLPWRDKQIDVVVEATGVFASYEKAKAHLTAGAKRVVVSAPVKDDPKAAGVAGETILMGVNDEGLSDLTISSNASCTTNASGAPIAILDEAIGIEKAVLSTVHAYTATQSIVDGPNKKDFRKGRAAAQNIVPTSTGAAIAVTKAYPKLANKFDGIALRVPVPVGSIVDITFVASRPTSVEEVNKVLQNAAALPEWSNVFAVTDEDIVSSDIIGAPYASIADLSFTRVIDGDLVKVLAWYDNESGYTHMLVEHVAAIAKQLSAGNE